MAVSFGVVTGATCSYGTVNGSELEGTAEIAEARNALGLVTNEQAYSRTVTGRVTAVLTGTAPAAGSSLTIHGQAGLCTRVKQIESNTGYAMVEAETQKKDSATQVALA
jgi:hypothetical protein